MLIPGSGLAMVRGLNIWLRERTVELIERVAGEVGRSTLVGRAALRLIQQESRARIRVQLANGARARAARDLQLADEWFPIDSSDVRGGTR